MPNEFWISPNNCLGGLCQYSVNNTVKSVPWYSEGTSTFQFVLIASAFVTKHHWIKSVLVLLHLLHLPCRYLCTLFFFFFPLSLFLSSLTSPSSLSLSSYDRRSDPFVIIVSVCPCLSCIRQLKTGPRTPGVIPPLLSSWERVPFLKWLAVPCLMQPRIPLALFGMTVYLWQGLRSSSAKIPSTWSSSSLHCCFCLFFQRCKAFPFTLLNFIRFMIIPSLNHTYKIKFSQVTVCNLIWLQLSKYLK